MKVRLPPLVLLLLAAFGTGAQEPQSEKIARILDRLEKRYATTDAFEYRFSTTKTLVQLTGPFELEGRVVFRKPHFLRMEIRGEENVDIYVNGDSIWLDDLDLGEVETYDFARMKRARRLSRLLPPLFLSGTDELREQFDLRLVEEQGDEALELIPREADSTLTKIVFSSDGRSRIRWMRREWKNGDRTETRFRGWKRLPDISQYYFTYLKEE